MKKYSIILVLILAMFACQKDPEIGDAGSKKISGVWVVKEYKLDGSVASNKPYKLLIYNTSFDTDSIWVSNIYDNSIRVKCAKISELSFGVSEAKDQNNKFDGSVTITDASIINNDSISFKVKLIKKDGTVKDEYIEAGHRYTGFAPDYEN